MRRWPCRRLDRPALAPRRAATSMRPMPSPWPPTAAASRPCRPTSRRTCAPVTPRRRGRSGAGLVAHRRVRLAPSSRAADPGRAAAGGPGCRSAVRLCARSRSGAARRLGQPQPPRVFSTRPSRPRCSTANGRWPSGMRSAGGLRRAEPVRLGRLHHWARWRDRDGNFAVEPAASCAVCWRQGQRRPLPGRRSGGLRLRPPPQAPRGSWSRPPPRTPARSGVARQGCAGRSRRQISSTPISSRKDQASIFTLGCADTKSGWRR